MAARKQRRRSIGTVRQLPSGRWQARHTGPDGRMRALKTFATKAEAERAIARETVSVQDGVWRSPEHGDIPLGAFLSHWLETRTDIAVTTASLNDRLLKTWIAQPHGRMHTALADLPLRSINQAIVREWHSAVTKESERRARDRAHRAASSPAAINRAIRSWARSAGLVVAETGRIPAEVRKAWQEHAAAGSTLPHDVDANAGKTEPAQAYRLLHAGFNQAVKEGLIHSTPCTIPGAGQRDTRNRRERETVSFEEARDLAAAMPDRYRAAVVVTMLTGLRAGELFALQRKHVDLDAGTLRVEQTLARDCGPNWFGPTKSVRSRRTVALPQAAAAALRAHMATFTPTDKASLVFGTANATPLGSGSRSQMFRRARATINRDDLTWHDLRHSAMVLWARTGASLAELMAIAGHASPKSAMHYQHVVKDAQTALAERLSEMVETSVPAPENTAGRLRAA
ncbi:histone-like nucleoid-structuring protein Lsr2 [Isoptericola sp. NPDC056134]|uniref:tyrosine-type recombinase/integrase n=1 Tax=Isoptericola sp. NPDC056134 TaxID=3345723 RepID=UPI0035EF3526